MQAFDAVVDDAIIPPPGQPEGCSAIEKIVLARAFPYEMPWILGIDPNWATPVSIRRAEHAGMGLREVSLAVFNRVAVVARRGWCQPDPKHLSVARIAEAVYIKVRGLAALAKSAAQCCFCKRVRDIGFRDIGRDFDEIVRINVFSRL